MEEHLMKKKYGIDVFLIIIIIVLFLMTIFSYLPPPKMSDQIQYYSAALKFPHRASEFVNHWHLRLGIILPTAICFHIFGDTEITYYMVPILSFIFFLSAIYWIGRILFSRSVGAIAALIILFNPYIFLEAADLLPDIPAEACFSAAIAGLMTFGVNLGGKTLKHLHKIVVYFIIGVLFGWSYLTREYYAVFFILIPIFFILFDMPFKYFIPIAIGMLTVLGGELMIGMVMYKNPFIRLITANPRETLGYIEKDIAIILTSFPRFLLKHGGKWFFVIIGTAFYGGVAGIIKKDKRFIFLTIWMAFVFIFLTTAGLLPVIFNWEEKVLLRLQLFRYWIPIFPPLVILGVATIEKILTGVFSKVKIFSNKYVRPSSVLLVFILTAICIYRGFSTSESLFIRNRNDRSDYLELRAYLQNNNNKVDKIWINQDGARTLDQIIPMYTHTFFGQPVWDGTIKYLNEGRYYLKAEEIQSGYVIVDTIYMKSDLYSVPEYLMKPPNHWKRIFTTSNRRLRIYKAGHLSGLE